MDWRRAEVAEAHDGSGKGDRVKRRGTGRMGRRARTRVRALFGATLVVGSLSGALSVSEGTAGATPSAVTLYVNAATGTKTAGCTGPGTTACTTIQDGVAAAELLTGDAVTVTVAAGTYSGGITITAGTLDSLTIVGKTGPSATVVTGDHEVGDVTVSGMTVTIKGLSVDQGAASQGGGIYTDATTTTLRDDAFTADKATTGGGVYNSTESSTTITDVTFSTDSATTGGGLFNARGIVATTHVAFSADSAADDGGGIYNQGAYDDSANNAHDEYGSIAMVDDTISADMADTGGGVYNNDGTATVTRSTFSTDAATTTGGGVANAYGTVSITDVTLSGDKASTGGGVNNYYGTATITDATFSGDHATTTGGGFNNYGTRTIDETAHSTFSTEDETGPVTITDVTFSTDAAAFGGGVANSYSTVTMTDVTFSQDSATDDGGGVDSEFSTTTVTGSIFDASSCAATTTDPLWGTYNVTTTATCELGPHYVKTTTATIRLTTTLHANTTTSTYTTVPETLALGRTSPAVDEVPKTVCESVTSDERGAPRPGEKPGTAHTTTCDAGAYELQVTTTTRPPPHVPLPPPGPPPGVTVVAGSTADATAASEFARVFPTTKGACPVTRAAVLATTRVFQDALSSQYLAQDLTTGTLLTPTLSLATATAAMLRQEGVNTVYIVGGPLAVATSVAREIADLTAYDCGGATRAPTTGKIVVHRVWGKTQFGTAKAVAEFVGTGASLSFAGAYATTNATGGTGTFNDTGAKGTSAPSGTQPTAILADGDEFQDAQAASVISYRTKIPLLLTASTTLTTTAVGAISKLGITQVILMGGTKAIANGVEATLVASTGVSVLRVSGKDYTDTARELARFEAAGSTDGLGWTPGHRIMVARGNGFTDGIAGAVLENPKNTATGTAGAGRPLLLTESPTALGTYLVTFLKVTGHTGIDAISTKTIADVTNLGGTKAVSPAEIAAMETDLSH
jgi:putative cell wall-binding protein